MKKVGVLGLGIIGEIWSRHYDAAGVLGGTWNRTAKPTAPKWTPQALDVAKAVDVIQIVVADPPAVRGILTSILPALGPGKIVVQSSTIDPKSSDEFLAMVSATGARYLEAPFTGSKPAAEARKTVYFLGGDAALAAELEETLSLVSETRFLIGTNGQASAIKLAMNLNIAVQMQGLCEALTLARDAGVSDEQFFKVLQKNVSLSGLATLKESKLRQAEFSPQFSVKHLLKDLRLASKTVSCREYPILDSVRERLHLAAQKGFSDEDFSSIIKLM